MRKIKDFRKMKVVMTVFILAAVVLSGFTFAVKEPRLGSKAAIEFAPINDLDVDLKYTHKGVIKIEDEIGGKKIVSYGLVEKIHQGGSALSCLKVD